MRYFNALKGSTLYKIVLAIVQSLNGIKYIFLGDKAVVVILVMLLVKN